MAAMVSRHQNGLTLICGNEGDGFPPSITALADPRE
jgi:hypothetical protein